MKMSMRVLACLWLVSYLNTSAYAQDALLINVNGTLNSAAVKFVHDGIKQGVLHKNSIVIIELNTPGGLFSHAKQMAQLISQAAIPVVTYIAPAGAVVSNEGIFILYASSLAAMADNTLLGSPAFVDTHKNMTTVNQINQANLTLQENKNMAIESTYISSLANLHQRDNDWAQTAVRHRVSITPDKALAQNVINVIANSPNELLQKIHGMTVSVRGTQTILNTSHDSVKTFLPTFSQRLFTFITDPIVVYVLLLLGIYALFIEFFKPGMILPGIIGVAASVASLYGMHFMVVNLVGVALLVLSIAFMVIEIQVFSFGILGMGGLIAFGVGSIVFFNLDMPGFKTPWLLISLMMLVSALFFIGLVMTSARHKTRPCQIDRSRLVGCEGIVREIFNSNELLVLIQDQLWKASAKTPVKKGQAIRVFALDKFILQVEPIPSADLTETHIL